MEFLLFDVSATCVFLLGYVTFLGLRRQRTVPMLAATGHAPRPAQRPAPELEDRQPSEARKKRPTEQSPCCREWPRLSAPR